MSLCRTSIDILEEFWSQKLVFVLNASSYLKILNNVSNAESGLHNFSFFSVIKGWSNFVKVIFRKNHRLRL